MEKPANDGCSNRTIYVPSPPASCSNGDKVKFKLGSISDECQILLHDADNKVTQMATFGFPRPSLASLELPIDEELSRNDKDYEHDEDDVILSSATVKQTRQKSSTDANPIFVELFDLHIAANSGQREWEETARWIKYEEDVEGVDHHWGRPHVGFLTFHSLIQIRHCFSKGVLLLDLKADNYDSIRLKIAGEMKKRFNIDEERYSVILNSLGQRHKHVAENYSFFKSRTYSVLPDQIAFVSSKKLQSRANSFKDDEHTLGLMGHSIGKPLQKTRSMLKRLSANVQQQSLAEEAESKGTPVNSECAQVFVGSVKELHKVRFAMVRLEKAAFLPELLNAPFPIKFIFVVLGPSLIDVDYHEIGRAISTLMSNGPFKNVALTGKSVHDFLSAIDRFVDHSVVVPPTEIDRKSLITVDDIKKALKNRKRKRMEQNSDRLKKGRKPEEQKRQPLQKTGRLFGGLKDDVRFRYRHYKSDITDAFDFQCITSLFFMFFAAVAPAISFGGLLGEKTDELIGTTETLVGQCVCGVIWGLFACQPLLIVAATGPVVVFEASLYSFCKENQLDFLRFRVWCSFWLLALCALCTMFDLSRMVRHVTRFTEDIFATLIPLIFIFETAKFVYKNFVHSRFHSNNQRVTAAENFSSKIEMDKMDFLLPADVVEGGNSPETAGALLSALLVAATFVLAIKLRQLRTSHFFSRTTRRTVGDFGVPISILVVVSVYVLCFRDSPSHVELLNIPENFSTTVSGRRWFIDPFHGDSKELPSLGVILGAFVPALFVFILFFVELEITELLLSTEERRLRKGAGFHFDLLLTGALGVLSALFGLPWTCAAAVQSLAHCSSLSVMKRHAPGERLPVDHVVEQRLTTIGVALLTGACSFLGFLLKHIPLAVLFGIFLYLGVVSMLGVQFLHRLLLVLVPQKYHPDSAYCQQVSMWRMHWFTLVQVVCLVLLWLCKSTKYLSLAFPFFLMLIAIFRKLVVPRLFSTRELLALDSHEEDSKEADSDDDLYSEAGLPM